MSKSEIIALIKEILQKPGVSIPHGAEQEVKKILKEKGLWCDRSEVIVNQRHLCVVGSRIGNIRVKIGEIPDPTVYGESGHERAYDDDFWSTNNTLSFSRKERVG